MKTTFVCSAPRTRGFTLVEMLVVIAIIAVLAAILVPSLGRAKTVAKMKVAKMEMLSMAAAIQQYESEYKRMPVPKLAAVCASDNPDCPDFTYGTTEVNGIPLKPGYPSVTTYGSPSYQASNAQLLAILRGAKLAPSPELAELARMRNPRNIVFFDAKIAAADAGPGLGRDGVLRDPWSNPYIVSLDMNDDNKTLDGCYGYLRKSGGGLDPEVSGTVMVWSFGPDGQASTDTDVGMTGGVNKDNILSWD